MPWSTIASATVTTTAAPLNGSTVALANTRPPGTASAHTVVPRSTTGGRGAHGHPGPWSSYSDRAMETIGSETAAGRCTVNVEPWPWTLSTDRSPPISRQKWRLIASPSPVPPYLLLVLASACRTPRTAALAAPRSSRCRTTSPPAGAMAVSGAMSGAGTVPMSGAMCEGAMNRAPTEDGPVGARYSSRPRPSRHPAPPLRAGEAVGMKGPHGTEGRESSGLPGRPWPGGEVDLQLDASVVGGLRGVGQQVGPCSQEASNRRPPARGRAYNH